jgi:hypothetical protein
MVNADKANQRMPSFLNICPSCDFDAAAEVKVRFEGALPLTPVARLEAEYPGIGSLLRLMEKFVAEFGE